MQNEVASSTSERQYIYVLQSGCIDSDDNNSSGQRLKALATKSTTYRLPQVQRLVWVRQARITSVVQQPQAGA